MSEETKSVCETCKFAYIPSENSSYIICNKPKPFFLRDMSLPRGFACNEYKPKEVPSE